MPEPAKAYPELQIGIERLPAGAYQVELRFADPEDDAEKNPVKGETQFDTGVLLQLERKPKEYGQALASMLMGNEAVRSEYSQIMAKVGDRSLRMRLMIGLSAPRLHGLRWELLTAPGGAHLFTTERVLFSRFMTSQDWRSVKLRRKEEVRALIAVAAPSDLEDNGLAKIDRSAEIGNAAQYLGGTGRRVAANDRPLTLASLIEALREPVDILYLVCHGALGTDGPRLFLENDDGKLAIVKGQDLADRLNDLPHQPRLVVLASCESAGTTGAEAEPGHEAFHSLAPLLAAAGVPAVFAMRGKIGMETVRIAMPVFFRELVADGQIDRAMGAARAAAVLNNRPDFWMMALYMRLRGGRLWYEPGFDNPEGRFDQWDSICGFVRDGECVPILGPDLAEHLNGNSRDVSREIAQANGFPLDTRDQSDLAKVAQYLATHGSPAFARKQVREAFMDHLYNAGERVLGRPVVQMRPRELQDAIAAKVAEDDSDPLRRDPVRIVAGLDVKVFVTAASDTLLEAHICRAQCSGGTKKPIVLLTNWRDETQPDQSKENFVEPSVAQPQIYYVFGKRAKDSEATWVLTEDDFFDYLIRTSQYKLMPDVIADALMTGSLLFLGFPIDDWKFRVLFRLILAKGGSKLLDEHNHVAVQVDPGETTLADARRARKHLQKYFTASKIEIYWGTAADFLRELRVELDKMPAIRANRSE